MKRTLILLLTVFIIQLNQVYSQEKTKVLLLATYHFGGTTSDNVKVNGDEILGNKKQKQLKIVLEKLEEFNPEKIYVENEPNRQKYWDSIYSAYKNGQTIKLESELFQIGIKLATKLNLKSGITCVDWHIRTGNSFVANKYEQLLDTVINYYEINKIPDNEPRSIYYKNTLQSIKKYNKKIPHLKLIDVFRTLNSEKYLDKMFYMNIASSLDIDKYKLNPYWSQKNMTRNVYIYQNIIQDILKNNPKRVMVLFGAGHIKALRNYLETHPKIKIVDTEKYLE